MTGHTAPALAAGILLGALALPLPAAASTDGDLLIFGFKVTVGGRYDDVRMCVATPAGVKGGPAMDVAFFAEIGIGRDASVIVSVPVMRPILFGVAFHMLQFEPEVTLAFRQSVAEKVDLVVGPTLGLSFHYGPDYRSERSGDGRRPSFFAMGPQIGAYLGFDFQRPGKGFNFQLGLHPYAATLFPSDGSVEHAGAVLGGMLEGMFRFDAR